MLELSKKQKKAIIVISVYPLIVFIISILINLIIPQTIGFDTVIPSTNHLNAMICSGLLLLLNHSLLMSTTEITRARYGMYATPEEWIANGKSRKDVSEFAIRELERNHNAHRNLTENSCYFIILVIPFLLVSPPILTTYLWLIGFSISRLGHSISYLKGNDTLRGVFMTISLICLYGIASHLFIFVIRQLWF